MGNIVRGTTPLIRYTFSNVDPTDISVAYLVLTQGRRDMVVKTLHDCTVGENYIEWVLTQEDTLSLSERQPCQICLDWLLTDGTRGVGRTAQVGVSSSAIDEAI